MPNKEWPPGPWDIEPKEGSKWLDESTGLWLETWRHPTVGHWCGYVYAPTDVLRHFQTEYGLEITGAHCGITYTGDDKDGFTKIGFDCAHSGDLAPNFDGRYSGYGEYRDLAYVQQCLRAMALRIAREHEIQEARRGV